MSIFNNSSNAHYTAKQKCREAYPKENGIYQFIIFKVNVFAFCDLWTFLQKLPCPEPITRYQFFSFLKFCYILRVKQMVESYACAMVDKSFVINEAIKHVLVLHAIFHCPWHSKIVKVVLAKWRVLKIKCKSICWHLFESNIPLSVTKVGA